MKYPPILLIALLLLTGCGKAVYSPDLEALLENPLYAEMYSEGMVSAMANIVIYQDPIIEDSQKARIIDDTKKKWLKVAQKSRVDQGQSIKGHMNVMNAFVEGEVMLTSTALHLSPEFLATPGPSLHMFISKYIDPRDREFPDETAINLGKLASPFGAQTFLLEEELEKPEEYRSVILWDTKLERLYGFAQINPL